MIDYKYRDLFLQSVSDKQLNISYDGGVLDNELIYEDGFELTESVCSEEQLRFGACESASVKIKIANLIDESLYGKVLTISETLDGHTDEPFVYGRYTVLDDVPSADRVCRQITAYDYMYRIISADVADWYSKLEFPMKLKEFRDSFFECVGVEQEETELVNDEMIVRETVITTQLSGKEVISAICELNGCFGTIRNGVFCYLFLEPISEENKISLSDRYIECEYQDYLVEDIDCLRIDGTTDISATVGTGENQYYISDNFLLYDKDEDTLRSIGEKVLGVISGVSMYRPANILAEGDPCITLGDQVSLVTNKDKTITTYVLQRTLSGIQTIRDSYAATGKSKYEVVVNSESDNVKKLWGQTYALLNEMESKTIAVYTYTNTGKLTVQTMEKEIITINMSAIADCIPIFIATVPFTMDRDGCITFKYYIDNAIRKEDTVTQYLPRGTHFVTLSNYLVLDKNKRGTLKVTAVCEYFESDSRLNDAKLRAIENYIRSGSYSSVSADTTPPTATIQKMSIKAVLYAQGLASTSKWDGTISIAEQIGSYTVGGGLSFQPFVEGRVSAVVDTTHQSVLSGQIGSYTVGGGLKFQPFTEVLAPVSMVVTNYTFNIYKAEKYTYESAYVDTVSGAYALKTKRSIMSVEEDVNEGRMARLSVDLTGYSSVESVVIVT